MSTLSALSITMCPSLCYRTSYLFIYLFAAPEVLAAVIMKIAMFFVITRRSPIEVHGHSFETSLNFYQPCSTTSNKTGNILYLWGKRLDDE